VKQTDGIDGKLKRGLEDCLMKGFMVERNWEISGSVRPSLLV